jgi:membrane fusion protein, multidrug efflux system
MLKLAAAAMRQVLCATLIFLASLATLHAQTNEPASVPVGVVATESKAVEKTLDFIGRVNAIDRVEVRARVSGYLEAVLFKEGDTVKEGDLPYRIEKALLRAAVEQVEGSLERSKA